MSDLRWPRLRNAFRFWRTTSNVESAEPPENAERYSAGTLLSTFGSNWQRFGTAMRSLRRTGDGEEFGSNWSRFRTAVRSLRRTGDGEESISEGEEGEPSQGAYHLRGRIVDRIVHPPAWLAERYEVRDISIQHLIRERLQTLAEHPVAAVGGAEFRGAEVLTMIEKYATLLRRSAAAVGPEVRVYALLRNSLENLAASLAVIFVGGVLFLDGILPTYGEIDQNFQDSKATVILTESVSHSAVLSWLRTSFQDQWESYIVLVLGADEGMLNYLDVDDEDISYEEHLPANSEVAVVLHTSGYAVRPKGVEITHKAYVCAFESYRVLDHVGPRDVFLAWTPLSHAFGFALNAFPMLLGALTVFKEPTLGYEELTAVLVRCRVTATFCFPDRILTLIRAAENKPRDEFDVKRPHRFPRVNKIMIGGDMIPGSLPNLLLKHFKYRTLHHYYGLTETFGIVIVSGVGERTRGFDGFPAPGCQIKIMPPEENYQPYCEECEGEICVRSDSLAEGYYQPSPFTEDKFRSFLSHKPPMEADAQVPQNGSQGGQFQGSLDAEAATQAAEAPAKISIWDSPGMSKPPALTVVVSKVPTGSESSSSIETRGPSRRPSDFLVPSDAPTSSNGYTPSDYYTSSDIPTLSDFPNPSELPTPTDVPASEAFGPSDEPGSLTMAFGNNETWLRTGDLGRYDRKGRITVLGRIMDRIKFAGVTLMPHELEDTIRKMRFVGEACVIPFPCDVTPTAAVVLKKSWRHREAEAAKRIHHLIRSEEISPLAGGIVFCQSLPRSEDCRVLRHQLSHIELPGVFLGFTKTS